MDNVYQLVSDSFKNFIANLNTGRDKQAGGGYSLLTLTDQQWSDIYRTSWMGRKVVDIPAQDATRKWREWRAEKDQIEAIENEEKRILLPQKVKLAIQQARLYGGSGIYFSIEGQDPSTPLEIETVKQGQLSFATVISRDMLTPGDIDLDPISPTYGKPLWYDITGSKEGVTKIDPSRLAIFIGNEVLTPEEVTGRHQGWGDSVLQSSYEAVRNADATAANIASLVYEAKVDVLQIPDLNTIMANDRQKGMLQERVILSGQLKGNNGMLVIDGEETYSQKTFHFAGLPEINMQAIQAVAGAADIPMTRFLGQSPGGFDSTGDSDLKNYYDAVASIQTLQLTPALNGIDEALIRSALGNRPDGVSYEWASLWQMSDEQRSKISLQTAQTIGELVDSGLFMEDDLAQAAANVLVEHSILPSFEFSEAAEPDPDEAGMPQSTQQE